MRAIKLIFALIAIAIGLTWFARAKNASKPTSQSNNWTTRSQTKPEWTPESIAKNPQGYLEDSQVRIGQQIAEREKRLASLADRRKEIVTKQTELKEKLDQAANIGKRMSQAIRRAEDEDRWPIKMAGQSFDRAKAGAIVVQAGQYVKDREALASAYDGAIKKMDDADMSLRDDISRLARMKEKVAIDLERVRINSSTAELEKLKGNEAELVAISDKLSAMSEETVAMPQPTDAPKRVDIESMLK